MRLSIPFFVALSSLRTAYCEPGGSLRAKQAPANPEERRLDGCENTNPFDVVFVIDEQNGMDEFLNGLYVGIPYLADSLSTRTACDYRIGAVGAGTDFTRDPSDGPGRPEVLSSMSSDASTVVTSIRDNIAVAAAPMTGSPGTPWVTATNWVANGYMDTEGLGLYSTEGVSSRGACVVVFSENESLNDEAFSSEGANLVAGSSPIPSFVGAVPALAGAGIPASVGAIPSYLTGIPGLINNGGSGSDSDSDASSPLEEAGASMYEFGGYLYGVLDQSNSQAMSQYSYIADLTGASMVDISPFRAATASAVDRELVASIFDTIAGTCVGVYGGPIETVEEPAVEEPAVEEPEAETTTGSTGGETSTSDGAEVAETEAPTTETEAPTTATEAPTGTEAPTMEVTTVTESPTEYFCDDDMSTHFDIVSDVYQKTCGWFNPRVDKLIYDPAKPNGGNAQFGNRIDDGDFTAEELFAFAGRTITTLSDFGTLTWRDVLCGESGAATPVCEETCGKCTDDCFDNDSVQIVTEEGETHDCAWIRNNLRNRVHCYTSNDRGEFYAPVASVCKDACESCDAYARV